jgi:hypothetical protein
MNSVERRKEILNLIRNSSGPLSGSSLARTMSVSRQVIVKDIASLKDEGNDIISTNRGYIINRPPRVKRVLKMVHTDEEVGDELYTILEMGGRIEDVFVWHKIYGRITAEIEIYTKEDADAYIDSLENGRSSPLKNVTSEYHYHTVTAEREQVLDAIEAEMERRGFLVRDEI